VGGRWNACLCYTVTTDFLYRARSIVSWSCRAHPKPVQSTPYEATSLFTFTHVTSVNFIYPDSQPICLRSALVLWHLLLGLATFCLCELDKQHKHTCSNCNWHVFATVNIAVSCRESHGVSMWCNDGDCREGKFTSYCSLDPIFGQLCMEMFIAKTCLFCVYNSNACCHVTCVFCLVWQACSNRINSVSIAMRDVISHRNTGCMFYVVAEHVSTDIQSVYFVLS